MNNVPFSIKRGEDPKFLKLFLGDPSGFEQAGYSPEQVADRNPDYLVFNVKGERGAFTSQYGTVREIEPQMMNFRSFGKDGRELYAMSMQIQSYTDWEFYELAQVVQRRSGGLICAEDIQSVRCSVGLSQIVLERQAADQRKRELAS